MTQIASHPLIEQWAEDFRSQPDLPGPDWLQQLRQSAAAEFISAGLPGRKTEAWKYTPLRILEQRAPAMSRKLTGDHSESDFPAPVISAEIPTIDGLNGCLPEQLPATPAGLELLTLEEGIVACKEQFEKLIPAIETSGASRVFAALNTAFLQQGLVIRVGVNCDAGTLLLRWAFNEDGAKAIGNARIVILLEKGARLELVEQFDSVDDVAGTLNLVTQAELAEGSCLVHTRVMKESDEAVILTSTEVEQAAESSYQYSGFDLGGGLVRHEFSSRLAGPGASAGFDGAFVLDRKRHVDNHISVDHASAGCSSSQFFRGVLGGKSRGVFNGKALIRPGADGSSVRQSNANLLLSGLAEIDTKPELEIYADEVEASHGATVGQLDEEAVFYLRSRGLSDPMARRLLTAAFCHAVTDRLANRELAEQLSALVDSAMPKSMIGQETQE
jgi:Fe-S cluster assembly protein SufD